MIFKRNINNHRGTINFPVFLSSLLPKETSETPCNETQNLNFMFLKKDPHEK